MAGFSASFVKRLDGKWRQDLLFRDIWRGKTMAEINFVCPMCNQPLEAPEEYANQVIECPACSKEITVPGPVTKDSPAVSNQCPGCGAALGEGVVLCVQCGFHTKLGKKISTDFQ